jgi:type IV pilus assembly protein PilW
MKTKGFGLVEFMVSMSLGLSITLIGITLYGQAKKNHALIQGWARLQENGRVAFEWLNHDIRMSGFIGCPRSIEVPLVNAPEFTTTSLLGSQPGYQHPLMPVLPGSTENDSILIQAADSDPLAIHSAYGQKIHFVKAPNFAIGTHLVISDCHHAETFQWDRFKLQAHYNNDAEVARLKKVVFYVSDTLRKNQTGEPIYALYRRDLYAARSNPTELVEGVEKFKILYGLPNESGTISYVTAAEVSNWQNVRSVSIELLLVSIEAITDQPLSHYFKKQGQAVKDRRLRHTWRQMIALRQRESWPCT